MPWWPCCLDRGALINVDAPGCVTSVVRGPTGHKKEGFHPGMFPGQKCLLLVAYIGLSTAS